MSKSRRTKAGKAGFKAKLAYLPYSVWVLLYYLLIFLLYHYLIYGYVQDVLGRQLIGLGDTMLLSGVLILYLILCSLPPYFWSRWSYHHPLWRAVESFLCYAAVALVLGGIFALVEGGEWSVLSGLTAGDTFWAGIGSSLIFLAAFIFSSWLGGRKSLVRRRGKRRAGS